MATATKVCLHCQEDKPLTQFYRSNNAKDGRVGHCLACATVKRRKYRSTGALVHFADGKRWKPRFMKVRLFQSDGLIYLDYIDLRHRAGDQILRLRPVVRELESGQFVEMLEMYPEGDLLRSD